MCRNRVSLVMAAACILVPSMVSSAERLPDSSTMSFFEYLGTMVEEGDGEWLDPLLLADENPSAENALLDVAEPATEEQGEEEQP